MDDLTIGKMESTGGTLPQKTYQRNKAPTIRSIENLKKEDVNSKRKGAKAFELDLLTAPGKPLRSIPRLKEALNEFFEKHQDDPYVTVNELAIAVGYTDGDALSKALFDESNPKYTALLRKAYALVDDALTKRMLYVADKRKDVKGYETALKRMDSKRDKYDPAAMQSDASLKISIDMKETQEIRDMVSDKLSALLSAQRGSAIDVQAKPANKPELIPVTATEVPDGAEG